MSIDKSVALFSNGAYWQARWYASDGTKKVKSLGPKAKLSKRDATRKCGEIAEQLAREPARRDMGKPPILDTWLDTYLENRTDLAPSSVAWQKLAVAKLKEHFGSTRIDAVTRDRAAAFASFISKLTKKDGKPIAGYTIKTYLTIAREIFGYAVACDATPYNPFDRIKVKTPKLSKTWGYITHEQAAKIIESCPNDSWRCLIALCRWAGLRRGEALRLKWGDVDWDKLTLNVEPVDGIETTKASHRHPPIQPRLRAVLEAAYAAAPDGAKLVCREVARNGIEDAVRGIVKRAGLPVTKDKPLHTLRKNLETDWLTEYPVPAVTDWLGNSPEVAQKHYHKTKDETVAKVTGGKSEVDELRAQIAALEAKLKQETTR